MNTPWLQHGYMTAMVQKQSVIQCSVKTDVPYLINRLFIENITMNLKIDAYRRLHKILAKDLQKSSKETAAVVLAIQHICSVLSSMQVKQFIESLVHMPQFSCTLMRVVLLPLKKPTTSKQVVELARNMCLHLIILIGDVKAPILSILRDFANLHLSNAPGRKELVAFAQSREPGTILENTDPLNLEGVGRMLLDICLKQQRNDALVEAMAKLLVSDSNEGVVKPRTGLLIDWLTSVEPELIGICPTLQMKLLFGKTKLHVKIDDSIVNSHACRPYLLTLLTHRASWATMHKCVGHLLDTCDEGYDPTAVLDFLWALTCNRKLWQGHDKFTPKHYVPENILLLSEIQLLNLVAYVVDEAIIVNERQGRNSALTQMETRLDLLLHCISTEEDRTASVVEYLTLRMFTNDNSIQSDMAHQFLLKLYMKIPKVICYLDRSESKKFVDTANVTDWTGSTLDRMSYALLKALAATSRRKSWISKSQDLELCARKMAAVHPILVLRQLPMLASSLTGRLYVDFCEFRSGHHLNLFVQVMGLLELLQPYLFNEEHRSALEDTLANYFQCFRNYPPGKELTPLLNRFVTLLQAYVAHDAQPALKYLHQHVHVLREIKSLYPGLPSLRALVTGIPGPRKGNNGEEIFVTGAPLALLEPGFPTHWPSLITTLAKIQGDDVYRALQEIDHLSSRKPSVLEFVIDSIAELLVSPQGNIRSLAHSLLARALKHRPTPNMNILSVFQRCLDSPRLDVLMSALDRLPEILLCMQEHALPLMQKVFELGVNSDVNTITHIKKSIALLNMQQGC